MKKIAILTSGGDSPGMNTAIRAIVHSAESKKFEIVGINYGLIGLLNKDFTKLTSETVDPALSMGGTILFSSRFPDFLNLEVQKKAIEHLKSAEIDHLIIIGGDGSIRAAQALTNLGFSTIAIPATIDNDVPESEYAIGFDTALNTYLSSIDKIRDTATSHQKTFIIEVMGKNCGNIALWSGIAGGSEFIIIPDKAFDTREIALRIKKYFLEGKAHCLIVLAEGVMSADDLGAILKEQSDLETRAIKLGHVARGGTPSAYDRVFASKMGKFALDLIYLNKKNQLIVVKNGKLTYIEITNSLNFSLQNKEVDDYYLLNEELN